MVAASRTVEAQSLPADLAGSCRVAQQQTLTPRRLFSWLSGCSEGMLGRRLAQVVSGCQWATGLVLA